MSTVTNAPGSNVKKRIPATVITLGWVSFFTDMASEMIYPLIPLFVVNTLGGSPKLLGLIDGVAEGISSGLRWIGGALSDRSGKRKPYVFFGYLLSALSKPVMALAAVFGGWPVFFTGRCSDRLGKAIRSSSRDALIADAADPTARGAAFGFHRAMDTAGAVAGPAIGAGILWLWPHINLAWIFAVALFPGLASAALVAVAVKEKRQPPGRGAPPPIFQKYPAAFWPILIVIGLFSLANSSDMFLILRAKEFGLSPTCVMLAFMLYNVVYALMSHPFGSLSDRIGRRPVIAAGWFVYAGVYFAFGLAHSYWAPWILLAVYGIYQSMADGVSKALVSDVVGSQQRAGAIGLVATVAGLGQLLGSVVTGALWGRTIGHTAIILPFALSAILAAIAAVLLLMLLPSAGATPAVIPGH